MLDWSYIANSSVWSIAGLLVGAVIGWFAREVYEVHEVLVDSNPAKAQEEWDGVDRRKGERRKADDDKFSRILGLIVIILSIVTVGGYAISQNDTQKVVNCQTNFNTAFSKSLSERARLASSDRQAIQNLVTDTSKLSAHPPSTAADYQRQQQAIFQRYLDAVDKNNSAREDTPIPEKKCG